VTTNTNLRTSPLSAPEYQKLLGYAEESGFNPLLIRKLLWQFNAPAKLYLIIPVLKILGKALRNVLTTSPKVLQKTLCQEWLLTIDFIAEHCGELSRQIGSHLEGLKNTGGHPLHGKTLSINPLYSIFANEHESSKFSNVYQHLQIHIFLAHVQLMLEHSTLAQYENFAGAKPILGGLDSSINNACRYMRDLSLYDNHAELLNLEKRTYKNTDQSIYTLPNQIVGTYFAQLHKHLPTQSQNKMIKIFGVFFNHTYINPTTRAGSGGGKRLGCKVYKAHDGFTRLSSTLTKSPIYISDSDDLNVEQVSEHISLDELAELDLLDDEHSTGANTYLVDMGKVYTMPYLARYLSARGAVRNITMENQMLKGRWSTMTMWEAVTLVQFCENEFNHILRTETKAGKFLALESLVLLMIMLWTGSSLERALKTSMRNKSEIENSELTYIADTNEWRIENDLVSRAHTPTKEEIDHSRIREKVSFLPDIANLSPFLEVLRPNNRLNMFRTNSIKKYRKTIKKILSKLPNGHRATESTISNFIFNLIVNKYNHNIAAACLATATRHRLGQSILHYSTPNHAYIRSIYIQTVQPVRQLIKTKVASNTKEYNISIDTTSPYIGSDYCPTTASINTLIKKLTKNVASTLKNRTQSSIINYHNSFTIYTLQMLSYALGFRSVKDAFIKHSDINTQTGLVLISDKDNAQHYHSRLVWVPDVIQQQLKNYADHQAHITSLIHQTQPAEQPNNELPYIFLLRDNFKILPLKPKNISPYIHPHLPLPLNVNRRYLRTQLMERGCPTEVINYYMGHWSRGEEPWSKHSSFSFRDYTHELRQHLPEILKNLGWKALKSKVSI